MDRDAWTKCRLGVRTGLLLALFGTLAGLVLVEAAVRIRQRIKYGTMGMTVDRLEIDPASGLKVPRAGDVTGAIRINSRGFRGPEIEVRKPRGRIRLAFLGGSTTFCAEASSNEATWPHLVWKALQGKWPGREFDYVNAGVPGYGVEQILPNFEIRVRPLQPDVVVIYEATNDLSSDTRALAQSQGVFEGKLEDPSLLARFSLTAYLLEKNFQVWMRERRALQGVGRLVFDPRALSEGFHARLRTLVTTAQQTAPVVAVATFTHKARREQSPQQQLQACNTSLYYMPYMSVEGILAGFEEYNRVIREVAAETGAILIDGEDSIPGTDYYLNDSVHFKDPGCVLMSQRVVDALVRSQALNQLVRTQRLASGTSG